ncbi:hypothetical protein AMTR_s00012p00098780 [Amborella trichopoda]|uniref:Uncharacterized protein n=1 Tax=Amborella trichopoda TaxID=13333 RepID=W1PKW5_AMBTC|nr:hypothetical protein AMTR_s00012p00098780 [Amborella trichopoda]
MLKLILPLNLFSEVILYLGDGIKEEIGYADFFGSDNATVVLEEEEVEEPTSTPLWKYMTVIGNYGKGSGGTKKWTCNFNCRETPFSRSYVHVRAHLLGPSFAKRSKGISSCPKLSKEE